MVRSSDGRVVPSYVLEAPVDSVWRKVSDRILVCAVPKARFYRSPPNGFKEFRENDSMRDSYSIYGPEIHCEEFDVMWKILDNPRQPVAWGVADVLVTVIKTAMVSVLSMLQAARNEESIPDAIPSLPCWVRGKPCEEGKDEDEVLQETDEPIVFHCEPPTRQQLVERWSQHRNKLSRDLIPLSALTRRQVPRKEMAGLPKALEAENAEWSRLRAKGAWDESVVREMSDVAAEARRKKTEVHFGYLFGFCVEKNVELPAGHPSRKLKYRVVFQGNRVKDQNFQDALFQDLGNAPATMDAARACDAYGCLPGHTSMLADAIQAYIQAKLKGTETWIVLAAEQRPTN